MKKKIVLAVLLFSFTAINSQQDNLPTREDTLNAPLILPLFDNSTTDGESESEVQEISPLLMSSPDIYTQFASFQFGSARFRMRGLASRYQQVYINGISVNDPETGRADWSSWGGLNDVMRNTEARFAELRNPYGNSLPGGYININNAPSEGRHGSKLSYAAGNRNFRHRILFSSFTGLMENNWALSFSASLRVGEGVMIPGTYFRAGALFLSAEKKISRRHSVIMTAFTAPVEQGTKSAATEEVYELAGDHQYNSQWGLQEGKVRNAAVSRAHKPTLIINDKINLTPRSEVVTSFMLAWSRTGRTALNWQDADNPRPDYYRSLPSYYYSLGDTATAEFIKKEWLHDPEKRQIDWNRMIALNQANLYTDPKLLGQVINTNETRARYILENQVTQNLHLQLSSVYRLKREKYNLQAGLLASGFRSRKFKEVADLLGATFWIDIDQFAEGLGVEEYIQQNDLDNPNKKVKEKDRFGYDYTVNLQKADLWCNAEYRFRRTDVFAGIAGSITDISRTGHLANGKFPSASKGKSETLRFTTGNFKAGFVHKLSGRQFISVNAFAGTNTPDLKNVFISPRIRNSITPGISREKIMSADISYHLRFSGLKARLSFFCTAVKDQVHVRTYWHDEHNTTVNLIMTDTDVNYSGAELGLEKNFSGAHVLQGAFGLNRSRYTNRPALAAWQDNNHTEIYSGRTSYLMNYHIGTGPELATGLGYKYNSSHMWFAGLYVNYFDQIYLEPNPDRRTAEATEKYLENETEQISRVTSQKRLPSYFLLNLNAGKFLRIRKKYFMFFNLNISNLLNDKNILSSGYESLRWDKDYPERFAPRYNYLTGLTFMAIINYSF